MRELPTETTSTDIILNDRSMTVSLIKHKPTPRLVAQLTDIKCYRTEPAKGEHTFFQSVLPIVVIEPHARYHDNELYDYSEKVHLSHGHNLADENNNGITGMEFRRRRPDLEHFFEIEKLQPMFAEVPVLGYHFPLAIIDDAHSQSMTIFRRLVETDLTDSNIITHLSFKIYYDYAALEDTNVNVGRSTIMPVVFRDELLQHAGMLVNEVVSAITVELQEERHLRSRMIAQIVNKWLSTSSTKRIANRVMSNPNGYIVMLAFVLTSLFDSKLEQAILETTKYK